MEDETICELKGVHDCLGPELEISHPSSSSNHSQRTQLSSGVWRSTQRELPSLDSPDDILEQVEFNLAVALDFALSSPSLVLNPTLLGGRKYVEPPS